MDFTDEEMKTMADGLQSDSKQASKVRVAEVINEFEKRISAKEVEDQEFLELLQMKPPEEETSEVEEEMYLQQHLFLMVTHLISPDFRRGETRRILG